MVEAWRSRWVDKRGDAPLFAPIGITGGQRTYLTISPSENWLSGLQIISLIRNLKGNKTIISNNSNSLGRYSHFESINWVKFDLRALHTFLRINFMRIPYLGRKVTSGLSAIGWPDSSFIFHFPAIVAIASIPSVHANGSPIHALGPPPNGK